MWQHYISAAERSYSPSQDSPLSFCGRDSITHSSRHSLCSRPLPPLTQINEAEYYEEIVKELEPIWSDRYGGWEGQTYLEALHFCAKEESRIPCPYIGESAPRATRGSVSASIDSKRNVSPLSCLYVSAYYHL